MSPSLRTSGPATRTPPPLRRGHDLLQRRLRDAAALGDHDDVVGGLRDLGQHVAGDEHRAALGRRAGAGSRAASGCPAGPGRWRARRARAPSGRRAARPRGRAAGACRASSRPRAGRPRPLSATSSSSSSTRASPIPAAVASVRRWLRPLRPGWSIPPSSTAPTVRAGSSSVANGCPCTVRRAGRRAHEPEQHPQRGRLAGAVGAQEADDAPLVHREREVVDGRDGPEVLGQARHLDRMCHRYKEPSVIGAGMAQLSRIRP